MTVTIPIKARQQSAYIVDDNSHMRTFLHDVLVQNGIIPLSFRSGNDFIDQLDHLKPAPVLLDLRMPGINGIEIMERLRQSDRRWPVIVLTGFGDVSQAVSAMKLGAIEFLEKPFPVSALENAVEMAIDQLDGETESCQRRDAAVARFNALTSREREIALHVASGQSNKLVARATGLSVRTVEMHRQHAMRKLDVRNAVDLAAIVADLPAGSIGMGAAAPLQNRQFTAALATAPMPDQRSPGR